MLESKYQAGFGMIILGQNPLTFMIPIYSTTVLYDDTTVLHDTCFRINGIRLYGRVYVPLCMGISKAPQVLYFAYSTLCQPQPLHYKLTMPDLDAI